MAYLTAFIMAATLVSMVLWVPFQVLRWIHARTSAHRLGRHCDRRCRDADLGERHACHQ